jgi:hypothetical protein
VTRSRLPPTTLGRPGSSNHASPLRSRVPGQASTTQLLYTILEHPELVAAVTELSGASLGRLIEQVGLEDAGEIVALASHAQLAEVFDRDLWQADAPGADEDFQPARFALWLHVLGEAGEAFLCERLVALPRDLLVLAVHRLCLVLDLDSLAGEAAAAGEDFDWTEKALDSTLYEEWEEFRLIARDSAHWDVLWNALLSLDRDHHHVLRAVVESCAALDADFIEDNGGLYEVLTSSEMLEQDVASERLDRRARQGYVAPADARAFLTLARRGEPARERDPITRAYFRELGSPVPGPVGLVANSDSSASPGLQALHALVAGTPAPAPIRGARGPSPREPRERPRAGLSRRGDSLLEAALAELEVALPAVFSERMEELAYLANVLLAGSATRGQKPRPVEALETTLAVVTAGLERSLRSMPAGDAATPSSLQLSAAADCLRRIPADLLFRLGGYTPER